MKLHILLKYSSHNEVFWFLQIALSSEFLNESWVQFLMNAKWFTAQRIIKFKVSNGTWYKTINVINRLSSETFYYVCMSSQSEADNALQRVKDDERGVRLEPSAFPLSLGNLDNI